MLRHAGSLHRAIDLSVCRTSRALAWWRRSLQPLRELTGKSGRGGGHPVHTGSFSNNQPDGIIFIDRDVGSGGGSEARNFVVLDDELPDIT